MICLIELSPAENYRGQPNAAADAQAKHRKPGECPFPLCAPEGCGPTDGHLVSSAFDIAKAETHHDDANAHPDIWRQARLENNRDEEQNQSNHTHCSKPLSLYEAAQSIERATYLRFHALSFLFGRMGLRVGGGSPARANCSDLISKMSNVVPCCILKGEAA